MTRGWGWLGLSIGSNNLNPPPLFIDALALCGQTNYPPQGRATNRPRTILTSTPEGIIDHQEVYSFIIHSLQFNTDHRTAINSPQQFPPALRVAFYIHSLHTDCYILSIKTQHKIRTFLRQIQNMISRNVAD